MPTTLCLFYFIFYIFNLIAPFQLVLSMCFRSGAVHSSIATLLGAIPLAKTKCDWIIWAKAKGLSWSVWIQKWEKKNIFLFFSVDLWVHKSSSGCRMSPNTQGEGRFCELVGWGEIWWAERRKEKGEWCWQKWWGAQRWNSCALC